MAGTAAIGAIALIGAGTSVYEGEQQRSAMSKAEQDRQAAEDMAAKKLKDQQAQQKAEEEANAARVAFRSNQNMAGGRRSLILTGPQGLPGGIGTDSGAGGKTLTGV